MIKIEEEEVYGWYAAIHGMRNPLNSHDKSDSDCEVYWDCEENAWKGIGMADLELMVGLAMSGPDHSKFMRMIHVQCDITAPLYWWKEMDQYKVGTVTNSESTMHTIHKREFTLDDFSHDRLLNIPRMEKIIEWLNEYREIYVNWDSDRRYVDDNGTELNRKDIWWQMIQLLPSSYNQKRTWDANYAVLRNIYHQRRNHKLDEWRDFCKWIESLPYSELITS